MTTVQNCVSAIAAKNHPKKHSKTIQYGTAGFRTVATDLDHVVFRMGVLSVLRSLKCNCQTIGLMITASHNKEEDNGVKIVDPMGEMLEQSWEELATELANVDDDKLDTVLSDIVEKQKIDLSKTGSVFVGQDTRPSSDSLARAALTGIAALSGIVKDYGIVTTPMLHYFVTCQNTNEAYGKATADSYIKKISSAFLKLRGTHEKGKYKPEIHFDGANGVGSVIVKDFAQAIGDALKININNDRIDEVGVLNKDCGAEYVKTQQKPPKGVAVVANARCVSVDGDADRVVYYYVDADNKFHLLDGDRIATLVAGYIMEVVKKTGLEVNLGLVQTAYANGSSTAYISEKLNVPVACVSTGVKNLHRKAVEFDIGIYFEANGHGTITFSDKVKDKLDRELTNPSSSKSQLSAMKELALLINLINETVGDALSDMLLVETVLHARGWDIQEWENTYADLPNRLLKVIVKDRNVVETTDANRKCTSPAGVQDAIDEVVKKFKNGRSFIRASGTEDVVRVYAEADTQENADQLANLVKKIVEDMAGGINQ
uniref:Phosphoacetylglucosamine mutase n=1 Tax=Sogatella furcifera TaxID=113103 RepID=A0A3G1NF24_SOGFU|nr:phosphoacetylglucosamine mutase [Sogatella furcifera]